MTMTSLNTPASKLLSPLAALLLIAAATHCNSDDNNSGGSTDAATSSTGDYKLDLLASVGDRVILPTYRDFETKAAALSSAVTAYAAARNTDTLEAAQEAFTAAMLSWQQAELFSVGPAGSQTTRKGGQDRRDALYSWPIASACRVDQAIHAESYKSDDFFSSAQLYAVGLDALEYLLFYSGDDTQCESAISASDWAGIRAALPARRAAYAKLLAEQISTQATALRAAWSDGFLTQFKNPGAGSVYDNTGDALNELMGAMFYIDLVTKDRKLAIPATVSVMCTNTAGCPHRVESLWAHNSKAYIVENLRALQLLMHGGEASAPEGGFSAALRAIDKGALADQMNTDIAAAITAVEGLEGSLAEAVQNDLASVQAAYAKVKVVNDQIKGEFATALTLEIPSEGAGDSD